MQMQLWIFRKIRAIYWQAELTLTSRKVLCSCPLLQNLCAWEWQAEIKIIFAKFQYCMLMQSRFRWPCCLRRGSAALRRLGLRVRILPVNGCLSVVIFLCCQVDLSSRGVLPSVECPIRAIAKPRTGRPCPGMGSKRPREGGGGSWISWKIWNRRKNDTCHWFSLILFEGKIIRHKELLRVRIYILFKNCHLVAILLNHS